MSGKTIDDEQDNQDDDAKGRAPAFQLYADAFLSSKLIRRGKADQIGWYTLLLVESWNGDVPCALPESESELKECAGADERAPAHESLAEFIGDLADEIKFERHADSNDRSTDAIRSDIRDAYEKGKSEVLERLKSLEKQVRKEAEERWKKVRAKFEKLPSLPAGYVANKRLYREHEKHQGLRKQRSDAGKSSAEKRRQAHGDGRVRSKAEIESLHTTVERPLNSRLNETHTGSYGERLNDDVYEDSNERLMGRIDEDANEPLKSRSYSLISSEEELRKETSLRSEKKVGVQTPEEGDKRGTLIPKDFAPDVKSEEHRLLECPLIVGKKFERGLREFKVYWEGLPESKARKKNWQRTWCVRLDVIQAQEEDKLERKNRWENASSLTPDEEREKQLAAEQAEAEFTESELRKRELNPHYTGIDIRAAHAAMESDCATTGAISTVEMLDDLLDHPAKLAALLAAQKVSSNGHSPLFDSPIALLDDIPDLEDL